MNKNYAIEKPQNLLFDNGSARMGAIKAVEVIYK